MKMQDVKVGEIYEHQEFRGKNGSVLTGRKVRVLETFVQRDRWSDRKDGVRVMMLKEIRDEDGNPTGVLVDDSFHNGDPWVRLLMAREIVSREEAAERREKLKAEEAERRRKHQQGRALEAGAETVLAARLGISVRRISVFFHTVNDELAPWRAVIDADGVAQTLANDDDADMIEAALLDIPPAEFRRLDMRQLAERIVTSMRNGNHEEG